MIILENISVWAGALMSVLALIAFIIRPVLQMMDSLTKITHSLDLLNKDLEASKSDRESLHKKWENHETRLDEHNIILIQHSMLIKDIKKGDYDDGIKQ